MSNDKPTAIATIKFYPNKHVEVELSSIKNITPRTLSIASNILANTYRGMKAKFVANEHRERRERDAKAVKKIERDAAKADKKEDERLATAALKDIPKGAPVPEGIQKILGKDAEGTGAPVSAKADD